MKLITTKESMCNIYLVCMYSNFSFKKYEKKLSYIWLIYVAGNSWYQKPNESQSLDKDIHFGRMAIEWIRLTDVRFGNLTIFYHQEKFRQGAFTNHLFFSLGRGYAGKPLFISHVSRGPDTCVWKWTDIHRVGFVKASGWGAARA